MKRDDNGLKPSDLLTEETLRRAEELYRRLPSKLALDKRGEAMFYNGAFTDLDSLSHREYLVRVADIGGQPWLTLISDSELPKTKRGLLVYNVPPRDGRRYIGQTQKIREGRRQTDQPGQFFAIFDIVQDARR